MDCYSVSPIQFLFCCSVSPYIFLKNYLYRIYFFNIELADNLALAFPTCFFYFLFLFLFFHNCHFLHLFFFRIIFVDFIFFAIELVEILVFLVFSLKYCSFPRVFFFLAFVSFFLHVFFHFFYPKLTFLKKKIVFVSFFYILSWLRT